MRREHSFSDPSKEGSAFDLMTITKPEVCVWNILRYSLRNWNEKGKEHDLEKIAHYSEIAWTIGRKEDLID